jgi:hemoglobin
MPDVQGPQLRVAAYQAGREPAHPSINYEQICALVEKFYDSVWADPALGPIFIDRIGDNRAAHLEKMKLFWSSVLLKTGAYKGRPVPAHKKLSEVRTEDFSVWLYHFRLVAAEVFSPEAAPIVISTGERIALSLWQAMNLQPGHLRQEAE